MDDIQARWDEIRDIVISGNPRIAGLVSQCRLAGDVNTGWKIVAPNSAIVGALRVHAELITTATCTVLETDNDVVLTYEGEGDIKPLLASPPKTDDQMRLFVPEVSELALKDDVHLMAIAPWTSSPAIDRDPERMRTEINYEANGMAIQISASPKTGLPTHTDYDIVILMQSWLVQQTNEYRDRLRQYETKRKAGHQIDPPHPPPRKFSVHKKDILNFSRRHDGGKQYEKIEDALNRLMFTKILITQTGPRKRRKGAFSLIADWATVSKTDSGEVLAVEIEIPGWIYEGIVETERPSVLTYSRDYFLLKKPNARLLYRLGKLHAKLGEVVFDLSEIHHRSGSRAALKEFNREFVQMLRTFDISEFPDYDLELNDAKRNRTLKISSKANKLRHSGRASH